MDYSLNLNETDLKETLRLISAASSIVSARTGVLAVMPSHEEIEELLKGR